MPVSSDGNGSVTTVSGLNLKLEQRSLISQQFDLWSIAMWYKLSPEQTQNFLRQGLMGDIYTQHNLFLVFEDTWPGLRNAVHQLRDRASSARFVVKPYVEKEGMEPTAEAIERADLVHAAMHNMRQTPGTDENNFMGMVYDLCNALPQGISAQELVWERRDVPNVGQRILPKFSAWVHPQWLTYNQRGGLNLLAGEGDAMDMANRSTMKAVAFPPDKFLIGTYKTRTGCISSYALYRCLGWWWSAHQFGRDWMFRNANLFGMPIRKAVYERNLPPQVLDKLEDAVKTMGANGYLLIPKGVDFDLLPAAGGTNSSAADLMERADHYAELVLLGQVRSSGQKMTQAGGNVLSEGGNDTFDDIRKERFMDLAIWAATVLTDQFARSVIHLNYGDEAMLPTMVADFTPQLGANDKTDLLTKKLQIVSAPEKWVRRELDIPDGEEGEKMIGGMMEMSSGEMPVEEEEMLYDEEGNPIDEYDEPIEEEEEEIEIATSNAGSEEEIESRYQQIDSDIIKARGNSDGARKGWVTRRAGGLSKKADLGSRHATDRLTHEEAANKHRHAMEANKEEGNEERTAYHRAMQKYHKLSVKEVGREKKEIKPKSKTVKGHDAASKEHARLARENEKAGNKADAAFHREMAKHHAKISKMKGESRMKAHMAFERTNRILAMGTTEGALKGWETRRQDLFDSREAADKATRTAYYNNTSDNHRVASELHTKAARLHKKSMLVTTGYERTSDKQFAGIHKSKAQWHRGQAKLGKRAIESAVKHGRIGGDMTPREHEQDEHCSSNRSRYNLNAMQQYGALRHTVLAQLDTIRANGNVEELERLEASLPDLMKTHLTDPAFAALRQQLTGRKHAETSKRQ